MRLSSDEFRNCPRKAITLLGMSGVGKTRLAMILRERHWFHYSGDYRIGTRYLGEAILDNVKRQAMQDPFLRDLLRSDAVHINSNLTVDNLKPLSTFLGKLGNPERGGIGLREFRRRQELHRQAEIAAMRDVPEFIEKAKQVYGYDHFVNDAGGSLCELEDSGVIELLARHTVIVYIKASKKDEEALIERAERSPKPLYYPEAFLNQRLTEYLTKQELEYVAMIDPDDFVRWVFPKLLGARIPRYEHIAKAYGYTITTGELAGVKTEDDFLALMDAALDGRGRA